MAAITYSLSLDGTAISAEARQWLVSLDFVESIDELDALVVEFRIPPGAGSTVRQLAEVGVPFVLTIDGPNGSREGYGDIMEVEWRRRGQGTSLILRGLDGLHRLRGQKKPVVWTGAHSSIVKKIAQSYRLSASVQGVSDAPPYTLQINEDDALFLKRLARQHNYFVRVEQKTLRFGRNNTPYSADVTVDFHTEVSNYQMTASLYDTITKTTVICRDYLNDKAYTGSATATKLKKISGSTTGVSRAKSKFGERELIWGNAPVSTQSEANELAAATLQQHAERFIRGQVTCKGHPEAGSGGTITISGGPWPMTGPFLIRQTHHTYTRDGSHRTIIDFSSDSLPNEALF